MRWAAFVERRFVPRPGTSALPKVADLSLVDVVVNAGSPVSASSAGGAASGGEPQMSQ
ncbi:MAG: hypothetical protein Q4G46_08515 [Propionibacteriaceae bacterium]|nr:hypothetical protein [Propionibacteriaceae bacterium]